MANIAQASTGTTARLGEDLLGTCHRIAGIGPAYEVIRILDDRYARISLYETGDEERYPIEDIRLDPHPDEIWRTAAASDKKNDCNGRDISAAEAQSLVGQYHKIGRYGSRYRVLEILNKTDARIRVHTSTDDAVHPISEILNDPVA
jgi:hypothetical protein